MKSNFFRHSSTIVMIVILSGLVAACDLIGQASASQFRVPNIPAGLENLDSSLVWKITGSCLVECTGSSGEMVKLSGEWHGQGDWIMAIPCLRNQILETIGGEIGLPAYGWVSNQADDAEKSPHINLDTAAGLVAMILGDMERANGVWAGLNIERLVAILRNKKLDTNNVEYAKLLNAVVRREISVDDCLVKNQLKVRVLLPEGTWCDGAGTIQAQTPTGGGTAEISLYSGINSLFRKLDGAVLRLSVTENPNGNCQVLSVLHEPIQGKSPNGEFP